MLDSADAKAWNTFAVGALVGGSFRYWEKEGLHHVIFASDSDVNMEVVHKTADERFSATVEQFNRIKPWSKLIINGSFGYLHGLDPFLGQTVMGDVIESKRKTISYPLKDPRAFLSFENSHAASATVYSVGMGAPPLSADAAIGGLCPLIIGGKKFDTANDFYKTLRARSPSTGKVVFGQSADRVQYVGVQPDGVGALTVDEVRDRMAAAGMVDAVLLDGSDSAMLFLDNQWKVRQSPGKNIVTKIGLCFFG